MLTGLRKELRGDRTLQVAALSQEGVRKAGGDTELLLPSSEAAQGHASLPSAQSLQGPAEH